MALEDLLGTRGSNELHEEKNGKMEVKDKKTDEQDLVLIKADQSVTTSVFVHPEGSPPQRAMESVVPSIQIEYFENKALFPCPGRKFIIYGARGNLYNYSRLGTCMHNCDCFFCWD